MSHAPTTSTPARMLRGAGILGLALCALVPLACRRFGRPPNPSPTTHPTSSTATPKASAPATRPAVAADKPNAAPATRPAPAAPVERTFESKKAGFVVHYPSTWKPKSSSDDVLLLIPAGATSETRNISMDEPSLPGHIPGMIPLHLVKNGYVDDQRKKHSDLKVHEDTEKDIAGAKGRLVHATWQDNGLPMHDLAILLVHGDHVYILELNSDERDYAADRGVFDQIAGSLKWEK